MFEEYYRKRIEEHQSAASAAMLGDMKVYLHHVGELKNYKLMLEQTLKNSQ